MTFESESPKSGQVAGCVSGRKFDDHLPTPLTEAKLGKPLDLYTFRSTYGGHHCGRSRVRVHLSEED